MDAGIERAGSANALAQIIGTTGESLSRAKKRARLRTPKHHAPILVLPDQVRFDLVQYLLGRPVYPPPKIDGARAKLAASVVALHVNDAIEEHLASIAWNYEAGMVALVTAAMERFRLRYGGKPRLLWPDYEPAMGKHKHLVAVNPAVVAAFDLAVGGPGWRRFLVPVAIAEQIAKQDAAPPSALAALTLPRSSRPARRR
jgi:hypothetical protein